MTDSQKAVSVLRELVEALDARVAAKEARDNCNRRTAAGRAAYSRIGPAYAEACTRDLRARKAAREFLKAEG